MSPAKPEKKLPSPLALSMGDPAGIGPEITTKAWNALKDSPEHCFYVVGNINLYPNGREISKPYQALSVFQSHLPVLHLDTPKVEPGQPDSQLAHSITTSIETALGHCLSGDADALITNPIAKSVLYEAGFQFPGHTEFLAHLCEHAPTPYEKGPVMMLSAAGLHVALATIHIPLSEVSPAINTSLIERVVRTLNGALHMDLAIENPRIALAGLNPHAGENGTIGREERDIINVAANALRKEGINVTDARPADTLFHAEARAGYDGVVAMYHDQGLIPVKTLDFHGGVNTTLGLPIVRTSPDHGTAFDIAGQGIARADSLIAAIKMARIMSSNRNAHARRAS